MEYINNLINFTGRIMTNLADINGGWYGFACEGLKQEKMPLILLRISKEDSEALLPGMTFVASGSLSFLNDQFVILCSDIKVSKEGDDLSSSKDGETWLVKNVFIKRVVCIIMIKINFVLLIKKNKRV